MSDHVPVELVRDTEADSMGVDVEGFLASLRRNTRKADVLVPPRGS